MKIPVYLACDLMTDTWGVEVCFRERRLVRRSESDKVIAIVEAPPGSRVRQRPDVHGPDQLLVPNRSSFWAWLTRRTEVIPGKYLIGAARRGENGLILIRQETLEDAPTDSVPSAPARAAG